MKVADLEFTGERVKEIRERLQLTQQAFASKLGVHQSTVAGWESGSRKPTGGHFLQALIRAEAEANNGR